MSKPSQKSTRIGQYVEICIFLKWRDGVLQIMLFSTIYNHLWWGGIRAEHIWPFLYQILYVHLWYIMKSIKLIFPLLIAVMGRLLRRIIWHRCIQNEYWQYYCVWEFSCFINIKMLYFVTIFYRSFDIYSERVFLYNCFVL